MFENAESHPSWAVARVNTVSTSGEGQHLFDSEIGHHRYVILQIERATRARDLNHDWIHGDGHELIELSMSMAQWGALVSSFGDGDGVPVTISRLDGVSVEGAPHTSRLAESIADVHDSGHRSLADIRKAFDAVTEARTAGGKKAVDEAMFHLKCMIENGPASMEFAAKSLAKHTENVVTKARADIEAMVTMQAHALGIAPSQIERPALGAPATADPSEGA